MVTDQLLTQLQSTLETEATRLRSELHELEHGEDSAMQFDANFADTSQVTAERGELDALAQNLTEALNDVEGALKRFAEGAYGRCVDCGKEISAERLEARPEAAQCMDCASK